MDLSLTVFLVYQMRLRAMGSEWPLACLPSFLKAACLPDEVLPGPVRGHKLRNAPLIYLEGQSLIFAHGLRQK